MKKAEIKEMLDYNISKAIVAQNHETSYYAYAMEVVLEYLRDILVEKGVREFRKTLSNFDAVKYYKEKSVYNFSTWLDEKRLKDSMNLLREKI